MVVLVSLKVNLKVELLEFNLCASFFKLSLKSFSVSCWNCFLNSLRSVINDFLSFLKSKTCCFTNSLDNLNLVSTYFCKYYIKFCLFVSCCCAPFCKVLLLLLLLQRLRRILLLLLIRALKAQEL